MKNVLTPFLIYFNLSLSRYLLASSYVRFDVRVFWPLSCYPPSGYIAYFHLEFLFNVIASLIVFPCSSCTLPPPFTFFFLPFRKIRISPLLFRILLFNYTLCSCVAFRRFSSLLSVVILS